MSTTTVTITLATGSEAELQAQSRLLALMHDGRLDLYLHNHTLHLDESAEQSCSMPTPTFGADQLALEGDALLAVFLHGQAHWALNRLPGGSSAVDEVKGRWLEANDAGLTPPPRDALSQPCTSGDYLLHAAVCTLQFHGLAKLLGKNRAREVMVGLAGYDWFRDQMADGSDALDGFISRHDLSFPPPPTVTAPGRQVEIPGGPTATLVSGDPTETELAERLTNLHRRLDLGPWMFSPEIELDASRPPSTDGPGPRISPFFLRFTEDELLLNYLQLQAMWQAGRIDDPRLEAVIADALPNHQTGDTASDVPASILLGCAVALHGLRSLIGTAKAEEAAFKHPRNGTLYAQVSPYLGSIRQAVQDAGIDLPTG